MSKIQLSKEIEINGEKVNEIEYDLESLTGKNVQDSLKELQKTGYVPTVQELDGVFHSYLFAAASGLDPSDISRLSMKDYIKATGVVRDFFVKDTVDSQQVAI